jgi:anaerobic magnesium-protoporphyrin IX monomethyl ester cyclase
MPKVTLRDYRLEEARGNDIDFEKDFSHFDVVATGACTSEYTDANRILETAKRMGKTTVMGGIFPTFNRERVLASGNVDFIVRGEGEVVFSNLINALDGRRNLAGVKGVTFKHEGRLFESPKEKLVENLDELPLPAYDMINLADYIPFTAGAVYSSRGCNGGCGFCTLNKMWGHSYRQRSIENIIEELRIYEKAGFNRVHFKDESIALNPQFAIELFGRIAESRLSLKYKVKSRVDQVTSPLLESFAYGGVDTIHTGIESFSQAELDRTGKGTSLADINQAVNGILSSGIRLNPVYIFGLPGQTENDLNASAEDIERVGKNPNVITYISFMTPHPGTQSPEGLRIVTRDLNRYTHKQPVCYPTTLGNNGLVKMVDTYHQLADATISPFFIHICRF